MNSIRAIASRLINRTTLRNICLSIPSSKPLVSLVFPAAKPRASRWQAAQFPVHSRLSPAIPPIESRVKAVRVAQALLRVGIDSTITKQVLSAKGGSLWGDAAGLNAIKKEQSNMAQLNKSPLGKVQGSLGDMAFRQKKGGTNVIAMRPKKPYTPPQDQASIDRRSRFKFSAKLAQSIISIPELAAVWQPVTPAGMSPFNYIIQKNDMLVNPASVGDLTTITPDIGFEFNCTAQSIPLDLTGAIAPSVALAALGTETGIDVSKEPNLKLAYVIAMGNPANNSLPTFWLISGTAAAQPIRTRQSDDVHHTGRRLECGQHQELRKQDDPLRPGDSRQPEQPGEVFRHTSTDPAGSRLSPLAFSAMDSKRTHPLRFQRVPLSLVKA